MNFLLITTKQYDEYGNIIEAPDVFRRRIDQNYWALYSQTRNKDAIKQNAHVLFFVSGKNNGGTLVGRAQVAEKSSQVIRGSSIEEHGTVVAYLRFKEVTLFSNPISFREVLPQLSFCPKNMKKWGVVLMGGVRRLSDYDFNIITGLIEPKENM